jgi:uncharacterized membrane protein
MRGHAALLAGSALLTTAALADDPFFVPVDITPEACTHAGELTGATADGSMLVGFRRTPDFCNRRIAVRWTAAGGVADLTATGGKDDEWVPYGVSADGAVTVGLTRLGGTDEHATIWYGDGTFTHLDFGPGIEAEANAVSDDGSTVVGYTYDTATFEQRGFAWSADDGEMVLPRPATFTGSTSAQAASADGLRVAGGAAPEVGVFNVPVLWERTGDEWSVEVLDIAPGQTLGWVRGMSDDGTVVVGSGHDHIAQDSRALAWFDGAMVILSPLPGDTDSWGFVVSGDGLVVGGSSQHDTTGITRAFLWDVEHGMRTVDAVLAEAGLAAAGWQLRYVTAISSDARTIAGRGTDPGGNAESWIAYLGPASDPADLTGDGVVDFQDLLALLTAWGPCGDCPEDIDGDGDVDFQDLLALLLAWG